MKKIFFILIISLIVIGFSKAQNYNLKHLNGPFGCHDIVVEDVNHNLYVSKYYGLYRSTDGGQTWVIVNTKDFFNGYTFHALDDGSIYFSGTDIIYVSMDQGVSWNLFTTVRHLMAEIHQFYLWTSEQLVITDQKDSIRWAEKSPLLIFNKIHSPIKADGGFWFNKYEKTLFTFNLSATQSKLMVTKDSGRTWSLLFQAPELKGIGSLGFTSNDNYFAGGNGKVFRSQNQGMSWSTHLFPGVTSQCRVYVADNDRIYAISYERNYYSDDYGVNWIPMSTIPNAYYRGFLISSYQKLFVTTGYGSFHSADLDGTTWNLACNGILEANVEDLAFLSESRILALTDDALFVSDDRGDHWQELRKINFAYYYTPNEIYKKYINVIDSNSFLLFENNKIIYYKDNWAVPEEIDRSIVPLRNNSNLWLNPFNHYLFISTDLGLYRSKDFGKSWLRIQNNNIAQLDFTKDGKTIYNQSGNIWISDDDGDSFSNHKYPYPDGTKTLSNSSGLVVAFQDSILFYSKNSGLTWDSTILLNIPYTNFQALGEDGVVYFGNNVDKLLLSRDLGKSFEQVTKSSLEFFNEKRYFYVSPGGLLYHTPEHDGLYRLESTIVSLKETEHRIDKQFYFYPNPFEQFTRIGMPEQFENHCFKIELYDVFGKIILVQEFNSSNNILSATGLTKGLYIYRVEDMQDHKFWNGKLMVN